MRRSSSLRNIRLWALEDEAAERSFREHNESMLKKAAEEKAMKKTREKAALEEKNWLIELVRRKVKSLQGPRQKMAREEDRERSAISFEVLKAILDIQKQSGDAFQAMIDKKARLLSPGARLSDAEINRTLQDFFPKMMRSTPLPSANQAVQRRLHAATPNIFSQRRVSFNPENTVVVINRSSTPSLRR